jgi:hypothetical protein
MIFVKVFLSALLAITFAGCAHPIKVSPDLARLDRAPDSPPRLALSVGYYIPAEVASVEVTTAGGGGDNVRYYPYRDLEPGFQKILSNVFTSVVKLTSISDRPAQSGESINYIVVPAIITSSGGSGFFTWPPTSFTVDLTSQVRDKDGKLFTSPRVVGTGSAETSERLSEHGIAGRRAMEDALLKMQTALFEANFLGVSKQPSATNRGSTADRLSHIKELRDRGLLTEREYEEKRKEILDSL